MSSQSAGIGSALPDQTGFSGYILTTDGATASWEASSASLPTQVGQSGKFLTTNGTVASWSAVSALPDQTGNSGKFLTTNGTAASWAAVTGLTSGAQDIDGVKTFTSIPVAAGLSAPTTSGFTLAGNVTTGGTAIGVVVDNLVALTTAGAKIVSFQNHEVEKLAIDKDGQVVASDGTAAINLGTDGLGITGTTSAFLLGHARAGGQTYTGLWMGVTPGTESNLNYMLSTFGGQAFLNGQGAAGVGFGSNNATLATLVTDTFDATGLGNGGKIKLKSPDGNTHTISVANGGTWAFA